MKNKFLVRLLCALLTVLTLVCMVPALTLTAAAEDEEEEKTESYYTNLEYTDVQDRLDAMEKMLDNGEYTIYCDKTLGIVAYEKNATHEVLFTNPWNMKAETNSDDSVRSELMAQIQLTYLDKQNTEQTVNSFTDAAMKGQVTVKSIKNGIRVEYSIGVLSARILVPRQLTQERYLELRAAFQANVEAKKGTPAFEKANWAYKQFTSYYRSYYGNNEAHAAAFPFLKGKDDMVISVLSADTSEIKLRELEKYVKLYLPDYTFEMMDNDHDEVEYAEESVSPPLFKLALEYTLDGDGLVVSLPANGLRYDESVYRILDLQVLPYMGASLKTNQGHSFIPDGSGALYELGTVTVNGTPVYGEDYALANSLNGGHGEIVRMPVFGQYETDESGVSRGYLAIIEEGDSLASIAPSHLSYMQYASVKPSFVTRQKDVSSSDWTVYAYRRYTDDYKIRYIMLSDEQKAEEANIDYYPCTWMGMACAYRDYLAAKENGFERLTDDDVEDSIPLYIETFGCMDTVEKVLSMPVTVSVPLTSFEDIATMYDYLAENDVTNVNFKMKGYANGGLYSDVPYKLKWEKSVGGKSGFKDLLEYANEKGFGLYPDFDFMFTTQADGGNAVRMKQNASRTIDNRYTSRRVYSATKQTLVSYYQMVLSPATYNKFYEKLVKKYQKYEGATGVSLSTMGNYLNSDYDEDKTVLREEAKTYVLETLSYFKDKGYDVMVDGGNAYVWNKVDHIIGAPLDSSRYNAEYASIPFLGVVLHGYVQFTGAALNMEGDMRYALLKAIENGASAYFVLSYANTDLLKEDELLSQNYSVRYDIWRERLVEIYTELNSLLCDVQTKLIIDHDFLDGTRVPDEDEKLLDIEEAAKEQAAAIENALKEIEEAKRQELRKAEETAVGAANAININAKNVKENLDSLNAERGANSTLKKRWDNVCAASPTEGQKSQYIDSVRSYIVDPYVFATRNKTSAAATLTAAKEGYYKLLAANANPYLLQRAKDGFAAAIDAYVALLKEYRNRDDLTLDAVAKQQFIDDQTMTVAALEAMVMPDATGDTVIADADLRDYLFAETPPAYANVGVKALYDAYIALMVKEGLYDESDPAGSIVNLPDLISKAGVKEEEPDDGGSEGDDDDDENAEDIVIPDPPKDKYSIDNKIVCVVYGDDDGEVAKTFILNFNDYAVQTTYNGVTYTIDGYGYVVIT